MPRYILNAEKTRKIHEALQDEMFSHCEDFEKFPKGDFKVLEAHCKQCEYYLACKISNEITFKIATNRW